MNYRFVIPQKKHAEKIVQLFTETFCDYEPMTQYLQLDKTKFKIFAQAVTDNAIQDGLSVIALDQDRVIACALVEDFADMREVPLDFDPKFKFIATVLEKLSGDFFNNKKFAKNHVAHLFITAVDKDYRRQGLSTAVNLKAMEVAKAANFDFIYSELTNIYNEVGIFNHIKNPKRLLGKCVYHDFVLDGIKPFAHLEGEAHGYIWQLKDKENSDLQYYMNNQKYSEKL